MNRTDDPRAARLGVAAAVVLLLGGLVTALVWDDDGEDTRRRTGADGDELPIDVADGEAVAYGREFVPLELTTARGVPLVLRNADDEPHTFTADAGLFDTGVLAPGGTYEASFEGPQRIPFHCDIHPVMTGVLVIE